MITNAREYQITRAQLARLTETLSTAKQKPPTPEVHPEIYAAEIAAIESEIERLKGQVAAYEDLLEGRQLTLTTKSLEELPEALIKARIANRWTQKQVADRLGVHEQQVQRYEASRYRAASFERLLEVAQLLGVHVEQKILLGTPVLKNARANLRKLGFSDGFVRTRIGPFVNAGDDEDPAIAVECLANVQRIFGWTADDLASQQPLRINQAALGGARLKLPGGRNSVFVEAYTAYAYRLACGASNCAIHLPVKPIPSDWDAARRSILSDGSLALARVVDWLWSLGVVVLPLPDRGAFHGAFWRIRGRNIIVIKQRTGSPDRLMHDLLHEGYHASQEPSRPDRVVVDIEGDISAEDEEIDANAFASNVLLNGKADALVKEVAKVAGGFGPKLKTAVPQVATKHSVSVGALANHLAWVLERQRTPINWWGTAHNLQQDGLADLAYARDVAFERLRPPSASNADVDLLFRALRAEDPI